MKSLMWHVVPVSLLLLTTTTANATNLVGRNSVAAFHSGDNGAENVVLGIGGGQPIFIRYVINSYYTSSVLTNPGGSTFTFPSNIVGVGGFYDTTRHGVFGLQNGQLWDVQYDQNGVVQGTTLLAQFGFVFTAVTAWYDSIWSGGHAAVALSNGDVYEYFYSNYGWVHRWASGQLITDIAGHTTPDAYSHLIANTNNGTFYDLSWYTNSSSTSYGYIYYGSGNCPFSTLSSMTAYYEYGIYGASRTVSFGNASGYECNALYISDPMNFSANYVPVNDTWNFGRTLLSISGHSEPNINHQVTAMGAGDIYDIYTSNNTQTYSYYYLGTF